MVSTRAKRTFDPALTANSPFFGTGAPSPVRAHAQPQLMLARAGRVRARYRRLQLHERPDCAIGRRKREECPIPGGVDEPT